MIYDHVGTWCNNIEKYNSGNQWYWITGWKGDMAGMTYKQIHFESRPRMIDKVMIH